MNFTDADLMYAAQAIQTANFDRAHRSAIDKVVSSGAASRLVREQLTRAHDKDKVSAVQQLMQNLEALAEVSPTTGRVLMATLWLPASDLRLHDVCDAIDLWIANGMSEELRRQLLPIAESESNAGSRKHLEQLLQNRG